MFCNFNSNELAPFSSQGFKMIMVCFMSIHQYDTENALACGGMLLF